MNHQRPNPDTILARVEAEETHSRRGRLKVFFGYAAGVGKTFAMLAAARREKTEGVDVVVGYVEPHARPETEALLEGLEAIPAREISYRGVTLREFDLDAALARRPQLILLDELAHSNAAGSRHTKRWQDVQELLQAGIDVWTTLNVQHIESLNDVIAQITGVVVRETLPNSILEQTDDIELIDISPDELIERLEAGKVYLPAQAERALRNFFQKANLVALREMSLRQAANRLRRDVDAARQAKAAQVPWATNERLLVCVGPSPTSARLIRTAKRMADAFAAEWLAVTVHTEGGGRYSDARHKEAQHLHLAEQLGAETHTLVGTQIAPTILEYARARNVTKIVVGKTAEPWWKRLFRGSVVQQILELSGEIDVYVIRGQPEGSPAPPPRPPAKPIPWTAYLAAAAMVAVCGALGQFGYWLYENPAEANVAMLFLLGVAVVAVRFGRGPAVFASVISVLAFDFFFVPPFYALSVYDAQYFLTFAVMLGIALLISALAARQKELLRASQEQEQRTAALYRFTKQLSEIAGEEFLVRAAGQQLSEIFAAQVVIFVRGQDTPLALRFGENTPVARESINSIVAQWVADHDQMAGAGTDTLPNATALFVPLIGSQRTVGALGVRPQSQPKMLDPDQRRLLESCASLIALSLERDRSVLEAHEAHMRVQTEQLRNALLSSVSHDLRTPLAAIGGAASTLLAGHLPQEVRRELIQSIADESHRMNRLIENLLDMTRLQSGGVAVNKQWHVLEEIIGSARRRLQKELADHDLEVNIPDDFPLISVDGLLLEQVFVNLLENAARYTPAGSRIQITAQAEPGSVWIRIADNGPGLPPGSEQRVFEKFFRGARGAAPDARRGVGLGLTICRSILEIHGGKVEARNRPEGGAEFLLALPCREQPPQVALDNSALSAGAS